jgi:beta-lactam-binding protein with PASTA domain
VNDSLKTFLIALVTTVAAQLLLGPYILKLQGFEPAGARQSANNTPSPAPAPPATADNGSDEAEKLTAPNLEGMAVEAARERLRDKGIAIIEDGEREDSGAAPGSIISQRPAPGAPLASKEIRVTVAKAAETGQVPDVQGLTLDDARSALVTAGFQVPEPTSETAEGKTPGTVLKQLPSPGAAAKAGSIVRLTVVAAEAKLKVPKVEGMYLSKAREALEAAGLKLGKVRRVEHPERGQNYVLGQKPEADQEVAPGTEIDLTVVAPD